MDEKSWAPTRKWRKHKPRYGAVENFAEKPERAKPVPPVVVLDDEGNRVATGRFAHLAGE